MMRRKQVVALALSISTIFAGCEHNASTEAGRNETRIIVTQNEETSQNQITTDSSASTGNSAVATPAEIRTSPQSVVTISDHLTVIDNSNGTAGVYRIHSDGEPQFISGNDEWNNFCETNPLAFLSYFYGSKFEWESSEIGVALECIPPENIQFNTFDSIELNSSGDLATLGTLPGGLGANYTSTCRCELDLKSIPEELRTTPFLKQDKVYCYVVAPQMPDNIPMYGGLYIDRTCRSVYEWEGVIEPTIGAQVPVRRSFLTKDDKLIICMSFPSITITDTIMEPQTLCTYQEALESVDEAVSYKLGTRQAKTAYVFAVELAYTMAGEFDVSSKSLVMNNEAIVYPVWRVYYYEQGGVSDGVACVDINAITGESVYSKEYPEGDERFFSNEI